jgi:hypothetical protein
MVRVAVARLRPGPYHPARTQPVARRVELTAMEMSGEDRAHACEKLPGSDCLPRKHPPEAGRFSQYLPDSWDIANPPPGVHYIVPKHISSANSKRVETQLASGRLERISSSSGWALLKIRAA